jgi:hypothetical protein
VPHGHNLCHDRQGDFFGDLSAQVQPDGGVNPGQLFGADAKVLQGLDPLGVGFARAQRPDITHRVLQGDVQRRGIQFFVVT